MPTNEEPQPTGSSTPSEPSTQQTSPSSDPNKGPSIRGDDEGK